MERVTALSRAVEILPAPGNLGGLFQFTIELYQCGPGTQKIQRQQDQQNPEQKIAHRAGDQVNESNQQRVGKEDTYYGQNAPDQGVFQTDVALKVPALVGVVPPLLAGEMFQ